MAPSSHFLHHSVNCRVRSHDAYTWHFRSGSSVYHLPFPEVVPCWCWEKRTNILYHAGWGDTLLSSQLLQPTHPPDRTPTCKRTGESETVCMACVCACMCIGVYKCVGLMGLVGSWDCCWCVLIASEWNPVRLVLSLQEAAVSTCCWLWGAPITEQFTSEAHLFAGTKRNRDIASTERWKKCPHCHLTLY